MRPKNRQKLSSAKTTDSQSERFFGGALFLYLPLSMIWKISRLHDELWPGLVHISRSFVIIALTSSLIEIKQLIRMNLEGLMQRSALGS